MSVKKLILVLAITILLLPGAVLSADVPGVTDKEIVVGVTTPLSGPAALWGTTGKGIKAWAEHVNAKGGVHGRKIKVIVKDDGYNPTRALANLEEMKGKVFAVCGLLGTAICGATKDFFPENKIPCITPYGNVRIWAAQPKDKLKWIFVAYPDYEDEAEYITKYATGKLGCKKLAFFYQNDDYGKGGLAGATKALKELGGKAEMIGTVSHELSERALESHALKLKKTGAEAVIIYTTPIHGALISKAMAKVGYMPKRLVTFPLADPIMYKIAGESWEGTYLALPGNSGVPGKEAEATKVAEVLLKYDAGIKGKEYLGLFGAMSMMHLVKGLENAGKDLTTESFIAGMEKIKDWKPEGVGAPVTYNQDRRFGVNASRMGIAKNGETCPLEPYTIFKPRF
jgi:ABC-type branched-subunit amino acid transport system substrate-binding protein